MLAHADDGELFRQQVAPIFERHCTGCHQGAKAKGGLVLTTQKAALAGGESGPAIVPFKPDESLLVEYVTGDDDVRTARDYLDEISAATGMPVGTAKCYAHRGRNELRERLSA